jgi:hypothetical protein
MNAALAHRPDFAAKRTSSVGRAAFGLTLGPSLGIILSDKYAKHRLGEESLGQSFGKVE